MKLVEIPYEDIEWVRLLREGDAQACEILWKLLEVVSFKRANQYDLDEQMRHQAVAETYDRLMKYGLANLRSPALFRPYCFQILAREIIRVASKNKPAENLDDFDERHPIVDEEETVRAYEALQANTFLRNCLEKLEERERKICYLFFIEEKSGKEIAALLHLKANNIRVIIHLSKKRLKNCLQGHGFHSAEDIL
jgi:RNA polymerase sigma-70 factor (ECF subfamily)